MRDMRYAIPETSDRISYPLSPIPYLASRIPHPACLPYPVSPIPYLASRISHPVSRMSPVSHIPPPLNPI
jgi:hypothetical protein